MFLVMEKPIFVVLRKYFFVSHNIDTPCTSDGGDILLFGSYEAAKENALTWCGRMASQVVAFCDIGELPASACQLDNLVFQCVGRECHDTLYTRVSCEIFQKYVL